MAIAERQRTEAAASILRPMSYTASVGGERHHFADLRALLAKATLPRSGDELTGLAARSSRERVAAQEALADLPLASFLSHALVPYEADAIMGLIEQGVPVDLVFQSIAGTEAANRSFGIDLALLDKAHVIYETHLSSRLRRMGLATATPWWVTLRAGGFQVSGGG